MVMPDRGCADKPYLAAVQQRTIDGGHRSNEQNIRPTNRVRRHGVTVNGAQLTDILKHLRNKWDVRVGYDDRPCSQNCHAEYVEDAVAPPRPVQLVWKNDPRG